MASFPHQTGCDESDERIVCGVNTDAFDIIDLPTISIGPITIYS